MLKNKLYVAFVILVSIFVGCGTDKPLQSTDTGDVPDWYTNIPSDPAYIHVVNTSTSRDMQTAVDKAMQSARTEIGRALEVKINGLQKRFTEETGIGENAQLLDQFTAASK